MKPCYLVISGIAEDDKFIILRNCPEFSEACPDKAHMETMNYIANILATK